MRTAIFQIYCRLFFLAHRKKRIMKHQFRFKVDIFTFSFILSLIGNISVTSTRSGLTSVMIMCWLLSSGGCWELHSFDIFDMRLWSRETIIKKMVPLDNMQKKENKNKRDENRIPFSYKMRSFNNIQPRSDSLWLPSVSYLWSEGQPIRGERNVVSSSDVPIKNAVPVFSS